MKRVSALFLILILLVTLPAFSLAAGKGKKGEELGTMEVVKCKEWVSLREGPRKTYDRITEVPLGAIVRDCVRANDTFIKCTYKEDTGYILAKYLKQVPDPGPDNWGAEPAEEEEEDDDWDDDSDDGEGPGGAGSIYDDPGDSGAGVVGTVDEGDDGFEEALTREATVLVESEEETITETFYNTDMGFTFWYDANAFEVLSYGFDSDAPTVVLLGQSELPDLVIMVEFMTPAATGQGAQTFLTQTPASYGLTSTERTDGVTEGKAIWQRAAGWQEAGDLTLQFYSITDGSSTAQAIVTLSTETVESYEPLIRRMIESIEFME